MSNIHEGFNPLEVSEAIAMLNTARFGCSEGCTYAWRKLLHAAEYLEKQIDEYFAQEEVEQC